MSFVRSLCARTHRLVWWRPWIFWTMTMTIGTTAGTIESVRLASAWKQYENGECRVYAAYARSMVGGMTAGPVHSGVSRWTGYSPSVRGLGPVDLGRNLGSTAAVDVNRGRGV